MTINQTKKKELTIDQQKWITDRLPALENDKLDELFRIITHEWEESEKSNASRKLSTTDLKGELNQLKGHFERALKNINTLQKNGELDRKLDESYFFANGKYLLSELARASEELGRPKSGIFLLTCSLVKCIDEALNEISESNAKCIDETLNTISEPKKGRIKETRNARLIIAIIQFFENELPTLAISSSPNTYFTDLINYLINDILQTGTANAKRQIDTAIEFRELF